MERAVLHGARLLSSDGVVLIPTETFYGLAAAPDRKEAVGRIHRMKGRPADMALPVLCADWNQVDALVEVPDCHRSCLETLWPGAVTAVFRVRRQVSASRLDGSLAVRIPGHRLLRLWLGHVGPVTGTSANRHGAAPCRTVSEALESVLELPDLVLDGGPTFGGKSSTLLDLRESTPKLLRNGPVAWPDNC